MNLRTKLTGVVNGLVDVAHVDGLKSYTCPVCGGGVNDYHESGVNELFGLCGNCLKRALHWAAKRSLVTHISDLADLVEDLK